MLNHEYGFIKWSENQKKCCYIFVDIFTDALLVFMTVIVLLCPFLSHGLPRLIKMRNVVVGVGVVSLTNQFTLNFFLVVMIGFPENNSN